MARFLLIHGAWHGAWCWARITKALQDRGHAVDAIDLPGVGEVAEALGEVTLEDCARAILSAISEPVWLVGHSLGGAAITAAAAMRPEAILGLIYVAASAPVAGESHLQALALGPAGNATPHMILDTALNVAGLGRSARLSAFYDRCAPADAEAAIAAGATWQSLRPATDVLAADPPQAMRRFYVQCDADRTIPRQTQETLAARVGCRQIIRLDADHSPFLSDPVGLAAALASFAQNEP